MLASLMQLQASGLCALRHQAPSQRAAGATPPSTLPAPQPTSASFGPRRPPRRLANKSGRICKAFGQGSVACAADVGRAVIETVAVVAVEAARILAVRSVVDVAGVRSAKAPPGPARARQAIGMDVKAVRAYRGEALRTALKSVKVESVNF
ncbi:unnamed protein product [Symbiodinium sp. CCMP2592]|nr:unnamed protein product [Symbiodinium sp. CCMP2592]